MPELRIKSSRLGTVEELRDFLSVLEECHNHLYAFDFAVNAVKKEWDDKNYKQYPYSNVDKPVRRIPNISNPYSVVLPEDRLAVSKIQFSSPGFWEFIASLNPLKEIREYLKDRHERKKDSEYRNANENQKGRIENEILEMNLIQQKIEVLKSCGVPEEKIRACVLKHVEKPLRELDSLQDNGLIEGVEMKDDEEPQQGSPYNSD